MLRAAAMAVLLTTSLATAHAQTSARAIFLEVATPIGVQVYDKPLQRGVAAIDQDDAKLALQHISIADRVKLPDVPNIALLPLKAWLEAKTSAPDDARKTNAMAKLVFSAMRDEVHCTEDASGKPTGLKLDAEPARKIDTDGALADRICGALYEQSFAQIAANRPFTAAYRAAISMADEAISAAD